MNLDAYKMECIQPVVWKTLLISPHVFHLSCHPADTSLVQESPQATNSEKQYPGDFDSVAEIVVTTGKGIWQQFMNAKATCEAHGYKNVTLDILPADVIPFILMPN